MSRSDHVMEFPDADGEARQVTITNPDRVLWPADQMPDGKPVTKLELASYLVDNAEHVLRAIAARPITLQRFTDGITGDEFFSKRPPAGAPAWLRRVTCTYPSRRRHDQLVIDDAAGLAWMAQMSTITYHPWPVRTDHDGVTGNLDNPDELRIDLDPQPGRGFADAKEAAFALKELLEELDFVPFVKTSGNRGVHVTCRIAPTHEFLDVRHGVIGIARELERRLPDLVTASWWKEERGERVFVDFNQSNRDRTLAGAWSTRPLPGAPVSFPLTWDELREAEQASDFTLRTVGEIVADRGDAWASLDEHVGDVRTALKLWDEQVANGQGELSFPPDYPKMPGEPPRVQPSKRRKDRSDEEYMAPKAERDAHWGTPIVPPFGPMLAKAVKEFPKGEVFFEPKWDGFRSLIWRSGDEVEIGSRNERPMTRYFPDLVEAIKANFPDQVVIDGEIVMVDPEHGDRLNFDLLQQRIHPAASRVKKLASETPASFVAFDLLAHGTTNWTERPFHERRAELEKLLAKVKAPIHLTPATRDRELAKEWFEQFEGAGLDGVIAKPVDLLYLEDKRAMYKIKHERTADCVVAGYRTHTSGDDRIGSLLLGLYAEDGTLNSVGVIGAFPMERRKELFAELQPLVTEFEGHPWNWGQADEKVKPEAPADDLPDNRDQSVPRTPTSSAHSRWNAKKDLSFTPLRPERVVEVRYDHMEGNRFRHTAQFVRWRDDKDPEDCTYEQLDEPVSYRLDDVLGAQG
ncbi:ATP-dependent DNA ligase [Aestuariimicrobium ganziense]|uniref:ATP-dependent DNA ligase n=1 Tax=Aestuariimicrobium ganziense TaxID=2773677 RepID=UPI001F2D0AAD|nr:ATP-dependent DNA ligase [Aestuariimicrobium ganziense]